MPEKHSSHKSLHSKKVAHTPSSDNLYNFIPDEGIDQSEALKRIAINRLTRSDDLIDCSGAIIDGIISVRQNNKQSQQIGYEYLTQLESYLMSMPCFTKSFIPSGNSADETYKTALRVIDVVHRMLPDFSAILEMRYPTLSRILLYVDEVTMEIMNDFVTKGKRSNGYCTFFTGITEYTEEHDTYASSTSLFVTEMQLEYKKSFEGGLKRNNCMVILNQFLEEPIAIDGQLPHPKDQIINWVSLTSLLGMPRGEVRNQDIMTYLSSLPKGDIFWRFFTSSIFFLPVIDGNIKRNFKLDQLAIDFQSVMVDQLFLQPKGVESGDLDQLRQIMSRFRDTDIFQLAISLEHYLFVFDPDKSPSFMLPFRKPNDLVYPSLSDKGKNIYAYQSQITDIETELLSRIGNKEQVIQFIETFNKFLKIANERLNITINERDIEYLERYIKDIGPKFHLIQQYASSGILDPDNFLTARVGGIRIDQNDPAFNIGLGSIMIEKDLTQLNFDISFTIKGRYVHAKLGPDGKLFDFDMPLPFHNRLSCLLTSCAINTLISLQGWDTLPFSYSRYLLAHLHGLSTKSNMETISREKLQADIEQVEGESAVTALKRRGFKDLLEIVDPIDQKSIQEQRKFSTSILADIVGNHPEI